jgi:hypothetical protein
MSPGGAVVDTDKRVGSKIVQHLFQRSIGEGGQPHYSCDGNLVSRALEHVMVPEAIDETGWCLMNRLQVIDVTREQRQRCTSACRWSTKRLSELMICRRKSICKFRILDEPSNDCMVLVGWGTCKRKSISKL